MLFGKKKKKAAQEPATIREKLAKEAENPADEVEITEGEAGEDGGDVLADGAEETAAEDTEQTSEEDSTPAAPSGEVPKDFSEIESKKGYLDFGAILVPAAKNLKVRLDIDKKSKRVVSLTIAMGQASIQLQAFSAPKSGGIWEDVRGQIEESVLKQKGRAKITDGRFGKELHARVPTTLKDGRKGWRAARFIGFEGKRWFLRGVIGGRGAIDAKAAAAVEELFARIVVVRGDEPMPPRELLKLQPPAGAKRVSVPKKQNPSAAPANKTNGVPKAAQQKPEQ
ncbi:DUF3710 domain-containing protein [Nesterenkonia sp. MY13]|uniref:DUF3710 domain-containing protein n=1 Tax=Nesterenkonia sedimenti TaxID=1463632 RepID=A0A7X8YCN8_9MICC|nr:DUF3710 domain-containing protein [Nesterenkonia sedimenti]NLS08783.1 DUF3710 domain-containing protein [Nesterenkonia sedimenti]